MVPLFLPLPPKVAVKKKNLSKYEEEEEEEVDDEARHDTKNKVHYQSASSVCYYIAIQ